MVTHVAATLRVSSMLIAAGFRQTVRNYCVHLPRVSYRLEQALVRIKLPVNLSVHGRSVGVTYLGYEAKFGVQGAILGVGSVVV